MPPKVVVAMSGGVDSSGEYTKIETREIARQASLPVAEKADSQEICFIQDGYADFIKKYLAVECRTGMFRYS